MAVDTAAKRGSVIGYANVTRLLVPPDGAIGQGDRQAITHLYSGILASAPAGGGFFARYYYDMIGQSHV